MMLLCLHNSRCPSNIHGLNHRGFHLLVMPTSEFFLSFFTRSCRWCPPLNVPHLFPMDLSVMLTSECFLTHFRWSCRWCPTLNFSSPISHVAVDDAHLWMFPGLFSMELSVMPTSECFLTYFPCSCQWCPPLNVSLPISHGAVGVAHLWMFPHLFPNELSVIWLWLSSLPPPIAPASA